MYYNEAQIARITKEYDAINNEINLYGMCWSYPPQMQTYIFREYSAIQRQLASGIPPGSSDTLIYDNVDAPQSTCDTQLGTWKFGGAQPQWVAETLEDAYRYWSKTDSIALQRWTLRSPDSNVGENGITDVASQQAYWAAHNITNPRLFDAQGNWIGPAQAT